MRFQWVISLLLLQTSNEKNLNKNDDPKEIENNDVQVTVSIFKSINLKHRNNAKYFFIILGHFFDDWHVTWPMFDNVGLKDFNVGINRA